MVNIVVVVGVVRQTPVYKEFSADSCYHQFQVGTDREWLDKAGRRNRKTDWINVIAWNKRWVSDGVREGDVVHIKGRLQYREAVDPKTGFKHYRAEVIAEDIRNVTNYRQRATHDAKGDLTFPLNTGESQEDFGLTD